MTTETNPGKFGTKLKDLSDTNPDLVERVETHMGGDFENMTPGEIQHYDADYGQADPRVEAANKIAGEEAARGGSGPK